MSAMSNWEAIFYSQKLKCIILTFTAYSLSRPSEWNCRKVMDAIHGHHTVFLAKWNHQTDSKILCICTKFPCLFACLEEWDISDILDKRRKDFYSGAHKTVYGKSAMNGNNDFSIYKLKMKFSLVRRLFSNPPLQDDILEFILKKLYGWKIRQFMEIGRDPQLVCVFFLLSAVSLEWGTITSLCLVVTSS